MCIGFPSLLGAKILGTWGGRRNYLLHHSAKTSASHSPVILHHDCLIDARHVIPILLRKEHTHTSSKIFSGAWLYQWLRTTTVKQGSGISPRPQLCPGFCVPASSGTGSEGQGSNFQVLPQGYYSSSSFPTPPLIFQSCSLATVGA